MARIRLTTIITAIVVATSVSAPATALTRKDCDADYRACTAARGCDRNEECVR